MKPDIIIVGGGLSGLSAGVELARKNARVLLLERRPYLGGRASSVTDPATGEEIDNGQHLLLGCYVRMRAFLGLIGTSGLVRFQERMEVPFAEDGGVRSKLRAWALPAPGDLMAGLLAFPRVGLLEKVRLLAALALLDQDDHAQTVTLGQWLERKGLNGGKARRFFFEPLSLATLNSAPERASLELFRKMLRTAFLSGRENSRIGFAVTGMTSLYGDASRSYIEEHKGEVRTRTAVRSLASCSRGGFRVVLSDGKAVTAPRLILALPPERLRGILPVSWTASGGPFEFLSSLRSISICSVHLWTDSVPFEGEWTGSIGTRIQWVFDKSRIFEPGRGRYISVTISDAEEWMSLSPHRIVRRTEEDLRRIFPSAGSWTIVRSRVVREPNATLSCDPATERLRPGIRTEIPGLFLSGDWVQTGLPATMESAVMSGQGAAEEALRP